MRTHVGCHFGDRSSCSARKRANPSGSNVAPMAERQRRHRAIAGLGVGHAVHRAEEHVGMALQDLLDGASEEVLAVDAEPLDVATREVDEAVGVAIAEIAGVVAATARARRRGLVVLPVAFEEAARLDVHDLTDRGLGVREPGRVVEARDVALAAVLAQDLHARAGAAERARRVVVAP
jgi:hypothetical protein